MRDHRICWTINATEQRELLSNGICWCSRVAWPGKWPDYVSCQVMSPARLWELPGNERRRVLSVVRPIELLDNRCCQAIKVIGWLDCRTIDVAELWELPIHGNCCTISDAELWQFLDDECCLNMTFSQHGNCRTMEGDEQWEFPGHESCRTIDVAER